MFPKLIYTHRSTILYGACMAVLLFVLRILEWRLLVISHALEVYIGTIAVIFTGLGIWAALKLSRPKVETVIVEREIPVAAADPFEINIKELDRSGLSKRELEVLQLMAGGMSNQEIATKLFVSLNTVKTHCSSLFFKLEVERRTQAIDRAKRIGIIQ